MKKATKTKRKGSPISRRSRPTGTRDRARAPVGGHGTPSRKSDVETTSEIKISILIIVITLAGMAIFLL